LLYEAVDAPQPGPDGWRALIERLVESLSGGKPQEESR
jgi:hypothetical protein